jgi:elongator complex protein 3
MRKMKNPIRTLSGVAPIAVMIPPKACVHGACVYCPSLNVPQSYTPKSPAVIRAKCLNYDSGEQVKMRIKQLKEMGHSVDKIEIIIMGGTFLSFAERFQFDFVKGIYDALNGRVSDNLEKAKKLNEKAKHRCTALCIETRPDVCGEKEIKNMLVFGCTRVELGVQAIDDKIYSLVNRGHKVKDVVNATKRLKEAGFKVGYHIMLGLPGSNSKKDIAMFLEIFKDERFKPDQLKIYPCQVIKGAELENWFNQGKYQPYPREKIKKILFEVFPRIPRYCRVMRIMREIPSDFLVSGLSDISVRDEIVRELRKKKTQIEEIRFREVGHVARLKDIKEDLKIKTMEYTASDREEFFLEAVNEEDILFGLLRLRFCENGEAMIRELHVYGTMVELGKKGNVQHKGLGKELLKKAEEIAKEKGIEKLKIISGVGVRKYYESLGYNLDDKGYMIKNF